MNQLTEMEARRKAISGLRKTEDRTTGEAVYQLRDFQGRILPGCTHSGTRRGAIAAQVEGVAEKWPSQDYRRRLASEKLGSYHGRF